MLKRKHKMGFITLGMFGAMGFGVFTNPYFINNTTNFRLHYRWIESKDFIFSPNYKFLGRTPNGKQALHMLVHSWLGISIRVETTTWGSRRPKVILTHSEEYFEAPVGPLEKDFDIVCSKDSRYIALVRKGWFLDCYDFKKETRNSFDSILHGQVNNSDINKWKAYHNRIDKIIGDNFISVISDNSEF